MLRVSTRASSLRSAQKVTAKSRRSNALVSGMAFVLVCVTALFASNANAQAMTGTYSVNNGGGNPDFTDLGTALQQVQSRGVTGTCILEVYDDGGTYQSNSNYAIGYPSNIPGLSEGNSNNQLIIRAAAGERPTISGTCNAGSNSTYNTPSTISFSYCHYVTLDGFIIENGSRYCIAGYSGSNQVTNITIRNCEIRGAQGGPGVFWYGNGSIGKITMENNFIHSNNVGGYSSSYLRGQLSYRRPNTQNVVRNNTIISNRGTANYSSCICVTSSSSYRFADMSNNIFVATTSGLPVFWQESSPFVNANNCNNNLVWQMNGATFAAGGTPYSSYSSWTSAGFNSNGVNMDPMLASVAQNTADFEIQSGSPAIDAGATNNLSTDIEGDPRPSGQAFDIGCDERVEPVIVTAGMRTRQQVYANAGLGSGGVEVAAFTLENASPMAATLQTLIVEGAGTGDHTGAYSTFTLYRDANGNQQYDAGTDVSVSTGTYSGVPAEATFVFTGNEADIASMVTNNYFLVAEMNGTTPPGQTLDFIIKDLTLGGMAAAASGTPTMAIEGVEILAPDMTVTDTSPATQMDGILGSGNNLLQSFEISYPDGPTNTIATIEIEASGTGDDSAAYDAVKLWRDDGDGSFDPNSDTEVDSQTFLADNGTLSFALSPQDGQIATGSTVEFFIAADFNLSGNHGDTYATQVVAISGYLTGTNVIGVPSPLAPAPGLNLLGDVLLTTVNGPSQGMIVDNDSTGSLGLGEVLFDVTVMATNVAWNVQGIIFKAGGTGDDMSAYSELVLYQDANNNGVFDQTDVIASNTGTSFNADDGTWEAQLTDTAFLGNQPRQFYLVGKLSGAARVGETFNVRLETFNTTPPQNGLLINLPTAAGADLEIDAASFDVTFNGPQAVASVNNNALAQKVYDFTVETKNDDFSITDITFTAAGSGDDASAFSEVALYYDANDNADFDFAGDVLATNLTGNFSADNGDYVATLSDTDFGGPTTRRFFLVVSLNGTAMSGESFNVTLTGMNSSSPSSLQPNGVPGMQAAGLMINNPVLSVGLATPAVEDRVIQKTGAAFSHLMAGFDLTASNGDISFSEITFNTTGIGDFVNDLAATNGFQLFLDDGDRQFDAGVDSVIFESGGMAPTIATSFAQQTITNGQSIRLWVQLNVLGSAGGSTPSTYVVSITPNSTNVNVTGGVMVESGAPAPTSSTLTLIDFFVESFEPLVVAPMTSGDEITIIGSGFTSPVSVTIGGVPADGVAQVSADGTEITGLMVPMHEGVLLPIVLDTGLLEPVTLNMTFSYASASGGGGGGGGCSLEGSSDSPLTLALLALLALASGSVLIARRDA